ncbi:MAG: histidine phosphatase family protein [Marmoricola sp.]
MSAPVYLVRHGQSEWNVLRLTQGQVAHPPLTARGAEQARRAAALIVTDLAARPDARSRAVRVHSSDLARARETAAIIAQALDAPVRLDDRLREQHLGSLQGKSYDETWAEAERHDWSDPSLPIAGGESLLEVRRRMVASLSDLDPTEINVVVSHGDAIRAAIAHANGEESHQAAWVDVPNGAVARLGPEVCWLG